MADSQVCLNKKFEKLEFHLRSPMHATGDVLHVLVQNALSCRHYFFRKSARREQLRDSSEEAGEEQQSLSL